MFNFTGNLIQAGFIAAAAVVFGLPAQGQTLASLPQTSTPAAKVGEARPIAAWTEFCRNVPSECAIDVSEPAEITLTSKVLQTITTVNRRVNAAIKPVTDQDHWGIPDRWDLAEAGSGDCEDYQLLKRKLLSEAGLPRRAMRMTVVIDEKNEGHAVLMVRTDRGDLILDNKTDTVSPWFQTGYVFVKRESQDAVAWVSLGGAISPTVTANR
jgi:predicted transglutaminase-like cysteine proteinase